MIAEVFERFQIYTKITGNTLDHLDFYDDGSGDVRRDDGDYNEAFSIYEFHNFTELLTWLNDKIKAKKKCVMCNEAFTPQETYYTIHDKVLCHTCFKGMTVL